MKYDPEIIRQFEAAAANLDAEEHRSIAQWHWQRAAELDGTHNRGRPPVDDDNAILDLIIEDIRNFGWGHQMLSIQKRCKHMTDNEKRRLRRKLKVIRDSGTIRRRGSKP